MGQEMRLRDEGPTVTGPLGLLSVAARGVGAAAALRAEGCGVQGEGPTDPGSCYGAD